jgi:hypothetical protein
MSVTINQEKRLQLQKDSAKVYIDDILSKIDKSKKEGGSSIIWKVPVQLISGYNLGRNEDLNGVGNALVSMIHEEGCSATLTRICSGSCDFGCNCSGNLALKIHWD